MSEPVVTSVASAQRSNEVWLRHLQSVGPNQQAALADLRGALLRGLRRALRHQADPAFLEDAAQEALLRILARLSQFQGRSQFVTWATSIAIRVALSELRRNRWKDVSLDALTTEPEWGTQQGAPVADEPATRLERQSLVEKMHQIIRTELTDKQQIALRAELKGMPLDEIARHLGSRRNAVYKLTHDARKRLKQKLEAAGYQIEDIRSAFVR